MGSPQRPVLANIFVDFHEEGLLFSSNKPDVYFCYVDNTFCLFSNETEADLFYTFLNKINPAFKFTLDKETNSSLPFLDVCRNFFWFSYFGIQKTELYWSIDSFYPTKQNLNLIKTLGP